MSEVLKIKSRAVFLFDHTSLDLSEQIDAFRDEDEGADMLLTFLYTQTMERSSFELDEEEKQAVLDGAEKIGRCEGAVNDERNAVAVCHIGYRLDVDNIGIWVAESFGIEELCVGFNRLLEVFGT